jgi:hypothetical protein
MMRFNDRQGAVIADESTWHLGFKYGYRRSNYGDHIFPLLHKETMQRTGVAAVYAGLGFPSFHFEAAEHARSLLNGAQASFASLQEISNVLFQEYQKVHERMVNDRMRLMFGFSRDELNSLSCQRDGRSVSIKQEAVIQDAKKTATAQERTEALQRITENTGGIMGYTPREGLQSYYVDASHKGLGFAYPLSVFGHGDQIGNHIYGEIAHRMNLHERRAGFDLATGLVFLLEVAVKTAMFECQMGGYFQLVIVDGCAAKPENMVVEIADHRLKLAGEITSACVLELLDRETASGLIRGLLLENMTFAEAEETLFKKCQDVPLLTRYLIGYKPSQERFPGFSKLQQELNTKDAKHDDNQCHKI